MLLKVTAEVIDKKNSAEHHLESQVFTEIFIRTQSYMQRTLRFSWGNQEGAPLKDGCCL